MCLMGEFSRMNREERPAIEMVVSAYRLLIVLPDLGMREQGNGVPLCREAPREMKGFLLVGTHFEYDASLLGQ